MPAGRCRAPALCRPPCRRLPVLLRSPAIEVEQAHPVADERLGRGRLPPAATARDGRLDAELVELDAVGGQLGQVLAARGEDEHEEREQHGDAGRVDEEDELLLEQRVELLLGHRPEALAEEVVVVGRVRPCSARCASPPVVHLDLAVHGRRGGDARVESRGSASGRGRRTVVRSSAWRPCRRLACSSSRSAEARLAERQRRPWRAPLEPGDPPARACASGPGRARRGSAAAAGTTAWSVLSPSSASRKRAAISSSPCGGGDRVLASAHSRRAPPRRPRPRQRVVWVTGRGSTMLEAPAPSPRRREHVRPPADAVHRGLGALVTTEPAPSAARPPLRPDLLDERPLEARLQHQPGRRPRAAAWPRPPCGDPLLDRVRGGQRDGGGRQPPSRRDRWRSACWPSRTSAHRRRLVSRSTS